MFSLPVKLLSVRVDILSVMIRFWECCTTHCQSFYLQRVLWRPAYPCHRVLLNREKDCVLAKRSHMFVFLHESSDWKLSVDFDASLVFPSFIAITYSRPDIVIYSVPKKTVFLIELTSPCEENFEDRHFDKIARYESLCVSIRDNGWRHHLFAIEVGAPGYCAYNVHSCFRRLGLNTKETKVALSELASTAIQCSFVIWLNRDNKNLEWASNLYIWYT